MARSVLARRGFELSVFLLFLSLSSSFTIMPLYASSNAGEDQTDIAPGTLLIRHMNIMVEKFPGIDEKRTQVQEQLEDGKMMPHEACSNCHIRGQSSGTSGP